jgi:hypothetical protein
MSEPTDHLGILMQALSAYTKTININTKDTIRSVGIMGNGTFFVSYTIGPDRIFKTLTDVIDHVKQFLDSVAH